MISIIFAQHIYHYENGPSYRLLVSYTQIFLFSSVHLLYKIYSHFCRSLDYTAFISAEIVCIWFSFRHYVMIFPLQTFFSPLGFGCKWCNTDFVLSLLVFLSDHWSIISSLVNTGIPKLVWILLILFHYAGCLFSGEVLSKVIHQSVESFSLQ